MVSDDAVDWTQGAPECADAFVSICTQRGLTLDYSPASLNLVDSLVAGGAEGDAEPAGEFLLMAACYVGEVIIRELGGTWVLAEPSDQLPSVRLAKNGGICNPVGKVIKLYRGGLADSVAFFFTGIKGVLDQDGSR
jgi:hypothetical protein